MSDFSVHSPDHGAFVAPVRSITRPQCVPTVLQKQQECEYREMEQAFSASGGFASADEVTSMLRRRTDQPISVLARWIVAHEVLSFSWRSNTILPVFQFDLDTMTIRQPVRLVVSELVPVLTDWEASIWFARPNAWLGDRAPVHVIGVDAHAVHNAARADRYLDRA